jgi:hypothetical protein
MNDSKRWRCPAHPDTTIGRTPGETEPPTCTRLFCKRQMELVPAPWARSDDDRLRQPPDDPRKRRQPRGGRPL